MQIFTDTQFVFIPNSTEFSVSLKKTNSGSYRIAAETPTKSYILLDDLGTYLDDEMAKIFASLFFKVISVKIAENEVIDMNDIFDEIVETLKDFAREKGVDIDDE